MTIVYSTNVYSGGAFDVYAPTSAWYTTVYGGYQWVYSGGFAFETTVYGGSGGTEYVGISGSDLDSFIYSPRQKNRWATSGSRSLPSA